VGRCIKEMKGWLDRRGGGLRVFGFFTDTLMLKLYVRLCKSVSRNV
jgi:hypothetical protein